MRALQRCQRGGEWRREEVGWEGEEGCGSEMGDLGSWCLGDGGGLGVQSTSVPRYRQDQPLHMSGAPWGRRSRQREGRS